MEHLTIEDVCNYHLYPLADNESPKLSADRLEYTLGNMYSYGFCDLEMIQMIYKDLKVNDTHATKKLIRHLVQLPFSYLILLILVLNDLGDRNLSYVQR